MALEEAVNELIITAAQERGQALFVWLSRPTPGHECWTGGQVGQPGSSPWWPKPGAEAGGPYQGPCSRHLDALRLTVSTTVQGKDSVDDSFYPVSANRAPSCSRVSLQGSMPTSLCACLYTSELTVMATSYLLLCSQSAKHDLEHGTEQS